MSSTPGAREEPSALPSVPLLLAVLGAAAIAVGAGLIYLPAGVIVGGVEALLAAYVIQYLGARREDA